MDCGPKIAGIQVSFRWQVQNICCFMVRCFWLWLWIPTFLLVVVISRRQKRVQLMRIREKDAKKRQQAGGQEGTYRRKPTPVKRYAGDLLAPVSVTQNGVCCGARHFCAAWSFFCVVVAVHRATCKVCGTDRWAQAPPLAAWAQPTTPWLTWTMTADPLHPSQLQPQWFGSEPNRDEETV